MTKWVYSFGKEHNEGDATMCNLLGGKGANLAEMAGLGLPVPPGFTITTEVCTAYYENEEQYPAELKAQLEEGVERIEAQMGAKFGNAENPLLVSVRSGARVSMPGMMDTVLNLGLNDETVKGLEARSGDARFAWDSYRRFIQMYGDVVLGVDHHEFEDVIARYKRDEDLVQDTDISAEGWQEIVDEYKTVVERETGKPFPSDPHEQLWGAVGAVFGSWMAPRAITYRKINEIPGDWGTAVNVQSMVFGNMGDDCATGVAFTRDPATGENYFYGEYLINAQGEDVVAGIRTPQSLTKKGREKECSDLPSMEETMPEVFKQLDDVRIKLETHYKDMQDLEFTVQKDQLFMLQTRSGKRTAKAALKVAVDMVEEGLITQDEALLRVDPQSLDQLLHPTLDPKAEKDVLTRGLPASPGAACGKVVFTSEEAEVRAHGEENVILCRQETSPEDIAGMHAARGILTSRGGMTSHAAVVARGMGTCCVAGAGELHIDVQGKVIRVGEREIREGETLTIDGSSGEVMFGEVATIQPELSGDFGMLMEWADKRRRMKVRTNAETPLDAKTAREFGAEGIGLCRTEHMFFDAERIQNVREMIFANDEEERRAALDKLLPAQRGDFASLFEIMNGLPVTVRLLDPPLHEFLPHAQDDIDQFAKTAGISQADVRQRLNELHEFNPMLGHRGCRLGITYPEIYEMQARAIFEGALEAADKTGKPPVPEIMIPLVGAVRELEILRGKVEAVAAQVFEEKGESLDYMIGTMIELPRAALTADEIAQAADFFSFGTNDLTQTCLGMSRDDAANFLPAYVGQGIYERDPFASLDVDGVGRLIEVAIHGGRQTNATIKLGICGEHGGDPASIAFCERVGLDYVSCSPYRVPIARLAAAQASLRVQEEGRLGKSEASTKANGAQKAA
ncbi:MAG: pyruvate, phosphate dikinase [Rhodospirillales bacterium]|nr:MAG: pyruvate, phosphate dikinase [Rhodospirillales bacterium]